MLKTQYILDFTLKKIKKIGPLFFLVFNSRWATKIGTGLGNSKLRTGPEWCGSNTTLILLYSLHSIVKCYNEFLVCYLLFI